MRVKTGQIRDPKPENGRCMTIEEMNPGSLYLREGQVFTLQERDPITQLPRKKNIRIVKLYEHHALCRVNGRYLESFTYSELYLMKAGVMRKFEEIYQDMTKDERQAFDFCMDWGDEKGAGDILAEHEKGREQGSSGNK